MNINEAVFKLNPSAINIRNGVAYDANEVVVEYDLAAAEALAEAWVAANGYKTDRASAYPSIADQLDQIYHEGLDAWKSTILAVKAEYPKP